MEQIDLVWGLEIYLPIDFDYLCTSCAHEKSHYLLLSNSSTTHYKKIELVVIDLTGPMSVPIWDEYTYALVIVKVSCRYPIAWLLKSKEEVSGAICYEYQMGLQLLSAMVW